MSNLSKILMAFFALVVLVIVVFIVTQPTPAPPPPLPVPNGYTNLIQTALMLKGDAPQATETNRDRYDSYLATNQSVLALARGALTQRCRVPVEYSELYLTHHLPEMSLVKRLASALAAEGRWHEMEGRPGEALKSYLDVVRMGQCASQGGLVIDALIGVAVETMGLRGLETLMTKLNAQQCREGASALEAIDAQADPLADLFKRDRHFGMQAHGWRFRLAALATRRSLQAVETNVTQKVKGRESHRRQVMVRMAARAYEQENGSPPKTNQDLVPTFLKVIPLDAMTGKPMILDP